MKKYILLLILGMFVNSANAQILIEIEGLFYCLKNDDHTAELCSYDYPPSGNLVNPETIYNKPSGHLVIPETVEYEGNSYLVTSVGYKAFQSSKELLSVVMPNSVTQIKKDAFYGCTKLASVQLSDNLISIGEYAFQGCEALTSIEFPATLNTIERCAFSRSGLTSLVIPKSVIKLSAKGEGAMLVQGSISPFYDCPNLSSIIVEEGNPTYDSRDNCNAIIETAKNTIICGCKNSTIPNSVTAIWFAAFYNCDFTSMTIPDGVTSIEADAFSDCTNLKGITIPSSVTYIGEQAFQNCKSLASLQISENVKEIKPRTFRNCYSLTSISLPDGLTTIGQEAFGNCISLPSVYLPDNLTNIHHGAFSGCRNLTSIEIGSGLSYISGFKNTGIKSLNIPPNIVRIGWYAFTQCHDLTEVVFHEGLTTIDGYAFNGCDSYTNVILPSTVTYIGESAFAGNKDKTVTCYAETVPKIDLGISDWMANPFFNRSTKKTFATTLTVPDVALQEYARTYPWREFGTIMSFSGEIAEPDFSGIVPATATADANSYEVARYAIDGRRLSQPQRGLNIIKMSNGLVKKVVIK